MGAGQSKEELLYQEVQNGNHDAVKALRRSGASLEWVDKEGRTPLILACTRGELLDMAITLLTLGANINVYRPGTHRGTPLHHAAKRGLEKTVTLLLSRGANPMVINDVGLTPLQMARNRGHISVVRILEEHMCLFSGMLREISGFGILETIAPNLVTKKIWAVVLPVELSTRRPPTYELAVYQTIKVPQPRTIISLAKVEIEEPKFSTPDPVLYIFDKANKTKYKFLSENEGDKAQLEKLYKACKGVPRGGTASVNPPSQNRPAGHQNGGSSAAPSGHSAVQPSLADAADGSSSDLKGWNNQEGGFKGWGTSGGGKQVQEKKASKTSNGKWEGAKSKFSGWGASEAGPSTSEAGSSSGPQAGLSNQPATEAPASLVQPSAPPLPEGSLDYPVLDTGTILGHGTDANMGAEEKSGSTCVICWDAPAEGACVPCGHLAGCMDCLTEIKAKNWGCPVCREQIQQVVKVYAV